MTASLRSICPGMGPAVPGWAAHPASLRTSLNSVDKESDKLQVDRLTPQEGWATEYVMGQDLTCA